MVLVPSESSRWCSWYWVSLQAYISTLCSLTRALVRVGGATLATEQIPDRLISLAVRVRQSQVREIIS